MSGEAVVLTAFDRDLKMGDIVEPSLGEFVRVAQSHTAGEDVTGHVVMTVPVTKDYYVGREFRKDLWETELNNRCLDLIVDAKTEVEKKLAIILMKYVKDKYGSSRTGQRE